MSRFNIGDIVRISKKHRFYGLSDNYPTTDGIVVEINHVINSVTVIYVLWNNIDDTKTYLEHNLKLRRRG